MEHSNRRKRHSKPSARFTPNTPPRSRAGASSSKAGASRAGSRKGRKRKLQAISDASDAEAAGAVEDGLNAELEVELMGKSRLFRSSACLVLNRSVYSLQRMMKVRQPACISCKAAARACRSAANASRRGRDCGRKRTNCSSKRFSSSIADFLNKSLVVLPPPLLRRALHPLPYRMSLRIFRFSAPDKWRPARQCSFDFSRCSLRLHRSRQRTRRPSHSGLRSLGALHRSSMPTTGQRHSSARRSAEQRQTVPRWPAVTVVTDQRLAGSLAPLQIACREKLADRAWATLFGVFLH